ncbi:MAG: cobalamin-dependent protein, partial [Mycobacteriales bacterium]
AEEGVTRQPVHRAAGGRGTGSRAALAVPALLDHLSDGDVAAATGLVHDLMDSGTALSELVVDLLAPAQREVGRRWQTAAWSIADEHVATGVIDAALAAATLAANRQRPGPTGPRVVVTCPDGEWHQLPARMFGALLEDAGVSVTQLGPSLPPRDLVRALRRRPFAAVVLSCTLPANLVAAGLLVDSAHEAGVPVLVGGQAFGPDRRRADALGADSWADSAGAAAQIVRRWADSPPPVTRRVAGSPAGSLSDALGPEDLADVLHRVRLARPDLVPAIEQAPDATREDVVHIVRHLDVAIAVADPRIFEEFTDWLVELLTCRGLPAGMVVAGYEAIDEVVGGRSGEARALLRASCSRLRRDPAAV